MNGNMLKYQTSKSTSNPGGCSMRIIYNPDEKIVKAIREGILKKGGHCPCRREMTEETMCMCKEFREQIADEQFEGFCHCMLYYKEK